MSNEAVTLGFVCVQNAGRSQMATAFAERERSRRGLEDTVQILTGGTHPAEEVHPEVVKAMAEIDIDLSDRVPQKVSTTDLNNATVVATMGCSTLELDADVEVDDWALEDPHGQSLEEVRRIRDEIEQRVSALFDEYTSEQ
jgi:arsenate reductase